MSQSTSLQSASPQPMCAGVGGGVAAGIAHLPAERSPSEQHLDSSESPAPSSSSPLPVLDSTLAAEVILAKLVTASRRGRLAGFEKGGEQGELFRVAAFGVQFDGVLSGFATVEGDGTRLTFSTRMKRGMPIAWCVILVATVWPGVLLTDSFLANFEFARNWWPTWWWYMPLTVPFVPWGIWSPFRKNRAAIAVSAREMIEKIRGELAP